MTEQGMDRNNSRVLPQLGDGKDVVFESEASEGGGQGVVVLPFPVMWFSAFDRESMESGENLTSTQRTQRSA